jgi:hypothetical protein
VPAKLDRAPTLIVVSCVLGADPIQNERTCTRLPSPPTSSCSAPTRRGLAGYWRTPGLLRSAEGRGRSACPMPSASSALLTFGRPRRRRSRRGARRRANLDLGSTDADPRRRPGGDRRPPFEVVVIGGGITGAGVRLDAAQRGYSVALLERGDYANGTSSRSSKMIHGGLRYLQNFDLGLVREALLERQLMVHLAPHLVYPTPFVVPPFAEERRDRKLGIGLNMYDVMATTRVGRSRREMRSSRRGEEDFYWSPDRHRTIGREEVWSWCRRSRRATRTTPTSSTTARPTTCGSC